MEAPPLRGVKWGEVDGSAAGARGLRQTPRSLPAAPAWALPLHQPIPPPPPPIQFCLQGEKGYLRVTRKGNDCGVSSEPVYVDLAPVGKQEA